MTAYAITSTVPRSMQVQLGRLFGTRSLDAVAATRTPAQWRKTLSRVVAEVERYLNENVPTDKVHRLQLGSALSAARAALQQDHFWPGYAEAMTRIALLLMGDYPDHRSMTPGRKRRDHYRLMGCRSIAYRQDCTQRMGTLATGYAMQVPGLSKSPTEALDEFRCTFGFGPGHQEFLDWYGETYPESYLAAF